MQIELKIRVGIEPYLLTTKRVGFNITQADINDFIERETTLKDYDKSDVIFTAQVSLASTDSLMSTVVSRPHLYNLLDYHDLIKQVNIDILDYPDNHIGPKHLHILNAARYKSKHFKSTAEVVRIYDHRLQRLVVNHSNIKLDLGAKYRIYLNDFLLMERYYSYELYDNQQIEEILYLDLHPGEHKLHIENISRHKVYMSDLLVNKKAYPNINSLNQSFEIN